jgi:hypothetical protein
MFPNVKNVFTSAKLYNIRLVLDAIWEAYPRFRTVLLNRVDGHEIISDARIAELLKDSDEYKNITTAQQASIFWHMCFDFFEFWLPAIRNYKMALKICNLRYLLFDALPRLWLFFNHCDLSNYRNAVLYHQLFIHHLLRTSHPLGELIMRCPAAFNEELGEISVSTLCRSE